MTFGEKVDTNVAIPIENLATQLQSKSTFDGTVSGKIGDVCKAEGCWIKLSNGNNKPVMVRMKNHAFTLSQDVDGKFAFVKGEAHFDTLSVEQLRDYAKDNGSSETLITSILEPELELVFEASGVTVR